MLITKWSSGLHNYRSEFLHARKSISSINEKAATLLETIVRSELVSSIFFVTSCVQSVYIWFIKGSGYLLIYT